MLKTNRHDIDESLLNELNSITGIIEGKYLLGLMSYVPDPDREHIPSLPEKEMPSRKYLDLALSELEKFSEVSQITNRDRTRLGISRFKNIVEHLADNHSLVEGDRSLLVNQEDLLRDLRGLMTNCCVYGRSMIPGQRHSLRNPCRDDQYDILVDIEKHDSSEGNEHLVKAAEEYMAMCKECPYRDPIDFRKFEEKELGS